jgi:hypothetical protein
MFEMGKDECGAGAAAGLAPDHACTAEQQSRRPVSPAPFDAAPVRRGSFDAAPFDAARDAP